MIHTSIDLDRPGRQQGFLQVPYSQLGDRANNPELDGNHAGCIFLQDCRDVAIRGVEARNNHGDGISFQICHDVTVEGCTSRDHSGLGLHPGSGSQRPLMRGNTLSGNGGGISIGHRDTDNVVHGNWITGSGTVGILFRPERGAARRVGIRVGTETKHIRLDGNTITGVATPVERLA